MEITENGYTHTKPPQTRIGIACIGPFGRNLNAGFTPADLIKIA